MIYLLDSVFQSTLPQGERQSSLSHRIIPQKDFNPRSHKGSDLSSRPVCNGADYFNPRSHKGSDKIVLPLLLMYSLFQSTLPQGERLYAKLTGLSDIYFNPRSHKGSDREKGFLMFGSLYFNPRSHKGSDSTGIPPI